MSPHPPNPDLSDSTTIDNSDTESELLVHGTDYTAQRLDYGTSGHHHEPALDRARRRSFIEEDEDPLQIEEPMKKKDPPVTWMMLPRKGQLAILTMARLSEPLVQTSLRSYLFYQLKSFDRTLPDSVIASQAGIMQGSFAAAQLCTAMLWGRLSDAGGRKRILLLGLTGTTISCVGFGFSRTFWQAMLFRMMAGALNGNVGVMRTLVSEIVREKKFQSRAFLILPMCANVGVIVGPMIGGITSDPAANYPRFFGGIAWLEKYPYAVPNLISAFILAFAAMTVFFGLEETHDSFSHKDDVGITIRNRVISIFQSFIGRSNSTPQGYTPLPTTDLSASHPTPSSSSSPPPPLKRKLIAPRYKTKLPFRRIFTRNVIVTLLAHGLLTGTLGTFNSIWYSFLSTPVYNALHPPHPSYSPHPPFLFTGGLGLPPLSVGLAMAIVGSIGITLQLILYPIINARLGTVRSWRLALYLFPLVYTLVPFLSLIPSSSPPPSPKTGLPIWLGLTLLLFLQTLGRTFASPASAMLINNCSPHPTVLGTIHGIGQSASSAAKTVGPALGGFLYGVGLDRGVVGAVFWALAVVAGGSCAASLWVREGDGHEVRLEGDDEAEEAAERENERVRSVQ